MKFFDTDPKLPQHVGGYLQRPAERAVAAPGGLATFALPAQPRRGEDIDVSVDGLVQLIDFNFTWDKKLWITFAVVPIAGKIIRMRVLSVQ